jgi:hypothetical protein
MNQEIKKLENTYTRRFSAYEKSYREAVDAYTLFKESLLHQQQAQQQGLSSSVSASTPSPPPASSSASTPEPPSGTTAYSGSSGSGGKSFSTSGFRLDISSFTNSLSPSLTSLAEKTKSAEILNWVVSSATAASASAATAAAPGRSSPKLAKYETAGELATGALTRAEKNRRAARKAWLEYIVVAQRFVLKAQILFTKLQGMEESFVLLLQDHMRKMIVFESSALANQQYDIQMLFKVQTMACHLSPHHTTPAFSSSSLFLF